MLRNLMLRMAENRLVVACLVGLGRRSGLASRFIAGESFEDAIVAVRDLGRSGVRATLDLLGEGVQVQSQAEQARDRYLQLLRQIHESEIHSGISIKLTQLGLDIDVDLCRSNLDQILKLADELGNFVRIDMESSKHTAATLDLYREAWRIYGNRRVGIVIQAYLYRSENDVRQLVSDNCNIRLCKGAYMESPKVAFPRKRDVDRNFCCLTDLMLAHSGYSAFATHDEAMIRYVCDAVAERKRGGDGYEFQMLYGIRRERQLELAQQGHRMRVYIPFGRESVPYFMRRLAERPANLLFVAKNLFRR
jgi:proline dehydrogenase